jgi:hypothetical protein
MGNRRKGCGNMVRMEVADAAVNEIMAATFRVPVKRLVLIKGPATRTSLRRSATGSGKWTRTS